MSRPILEREREFALLAAAVQDASGGAGSVVLAYGEAGIGRSSLVEAMRPRLPAGARLLVGYCDDLATPRTLGPSGIWSTRWAGRWHSRCVGRAGPLRNRSLGSTSHPDDPSH